MNDPLAFMNSTSAIAIRVLSSLIASFATLVLMPLLAPGNHKHPPGIIILCSIAMMGAGWLMLPVKSRLLGIIHSILMMVVGGYLLSLVQPFFLGSNGMEDNPAAGAIVSANLFIAVFGLVTIFAGIAVIFSFASQSSKNI
jgi:hypothetical protein